MEDVKKNENIEQGEEGDKTQHDRAEKSRDYANEATKLHMSLKTALAMRAWMRHAWRGLRKEEDGKKTRKGGRMMAIIKDWVNATNDVVHCGLWGTEPEDIKERKELAQSEARIRAPRHTNTITMETMVRVIRAMTKDLHAQQGLGTEKDERRLKRRLRTARQTDRIEAIEARRKQQVRQLEKNLAPPASTVARSYAFAAAKTDNNAPPPSAPASAPVAPATLTEPAVIVTAGERSVGPGPQRERATPWLMPRVNKETKDDTGARF